MAPRPRLFPPLSMKDVLNELGSLNDRDFSLLLADTTTPAAFDSSQERCETSRQED